MLQRNLSFEDTASRSATGELASGARTILGFASLCARAISGETEVPGQLSREALAILVCAANRGMIDLRISKEGFDSTQRLLSVCVEIADGHWLLFRQTGNARRTIEFLDGFRELCEAGLVIHHQLADFSLTRAGFELAGTLQLSDFEQETRFATKIEY